MTQIEGTHPDRFCAVVLALAVLGALVTPSRAWPKTPVSDLRFKVFFPASTHAQPITGRVFVMISKTRPVIGWA